MNAETNNENTGLKDAEKHCLTDFALVFRYVSQICHAMAVQKGWWDRDRHDAELIALIHSELSEALEGLRAGNPPDDKIPQWSSAEAELADAVIRIMDMAAVRGWDVGGAIEAKVKFNATRPHKHGGKVF